jgi:hypothetical protein
MSIKISVVLDWEEEDVLRHLLIPNTLKGDELHLAILQSFQLAEGEMASYYRSNSDWEQGEEVPLLAFDESQKSMKDFTAGELLGNQEARLLYVYDFLAMWTFYIETLSIDESPQEGIKVILIEGLTPAEAPERPAGEAEKDLFGELDLDFEEYNDLD